MIFYQNWVLTYFCIVTVNVIKQLIELQIKLDLINSVYSRWIFFLFKFLIFLHNDLGRSLCKNKKCLNRFPFENSYCILTNQSISFFFSIYAPKDLLILICIRWLFVAMYDSEYHFLIYCCWRQSILTGIHCNLYFLGT